MRRNIAKLALVALLAGCCNTVSLKKGDLPGGDETSGQWHQHGKPDHKKQCCPYAEKNPASVTWTVDNVGNYMSINGVKTDLSSVANYNNWPSTKVSSVMLAPGDTFCINGGNAGGPNSILATIKYIDQDGNTQYLSTSSNWICDGLSAKSFGNNGAGPWGNFPSIRPEAEFIWNNEIWSPTSETTCCVTIPCCLKEKKPHCNHNHDEDCDEDCDDDDDDDDEYDDCN